MRCRNQGRFVGSHSETTMFWRFFRRERMKPHAPSGVRVYAVGDIHGAAELVDQVLRKIDEDRDLHPAHTDSGRWTRVEDSWVIGERLGWCAMGRGGEPWRGLLVI